MISAVNEFQIGGNTEGFTTKDFDQSQRLKVITLNEETVGMFQQRTKEWSLQAIEYKPFLRFAVANALDAACSHTLGCYLRGVLDDRDTGAFLLNYAGGTESGRTDFHIALSTAISHLIGLPNFDAMYGKYYARFTVRNDDNSDSYLRQPDRRLELHNDGTYVRERTDFVLMMKLAEEHMEGGDSLLLHIDDWEGLPQFYRHPLAKQPIQWGSPPSKNIGYKVEHPVFFEEDIFGKPHMLYIDQFAEPRNMHEGLYLHELGESLERDPNYLSVPVPTGAMLVVHNHRWLHGRDRFVPRQGLHRELLRQRGVFASRQQSILALSA